MLALGSSLSSGISERSNSPTFQASAAAGPSFARVSFDFTNLDLQ